MSAPASNVITDVTVGIVQRPDGRVLLAERPANKPWAGYWEFPGGKIETGESVRHALTRELHEELGIDLEDAYSWITRVYAYPEKTVRLHFLRVRRWHGTPHGREAQRLSWEDPSAITVQPLLPANEYVLQALNLPSVYAITTAGKIGVAPFLERLHIALEGGVRLIQVREREMSSDALVDFTRRVVSVAHLRGARVLVNADPSIARDAGADGVHVSSAALMRLDAPPTDFWAASCHDAAELAQVARLNASFAVLSPVLATTSHPGAPGIGWEKFGELAMDRPFPVYALGGMRRTLLETAMRHGAHGIAMLSGVW